MSDGFFGRIMNLLRGAGAELLNNLERENPEAVYQAAIDAESARLREARASIRRLSAQESKLKEEAARLEEEIDALTREAAALATSDEAKALDLLITKEAKVDKLEANHSYQKAVAEQLAENEAMLPTMEEKLEALKKEREEMRARLRIMALNEAREDADPEGIPSNASQAALQQVRARLAKADAHRHEALRAAEEAKRRARKELERLKAAKKESDPQLSAASAEEPSSASPSSSSSPPAPRVKRTL